MAPTYRVFQKNGPPGLFWR